MIQPKQGRVGGGVSVALLVLLAAGCDNGARSRQPSQQPPAATQQPVSETPASPPLATDIALPPWKGDAALEEKLDDYQAISGYEIRPPKDYRKKEVSEPGPLNIQVHWVGTPRADGSRPQLTVLLLESPTTTEKPEHLLQNLFIPLGDDTRRTAFEAGQIGGLQFQRAGWRGTRSLAGRQGAQVTAKQQGMSYGAQDGKIYILMNFQDSAAHSEEFAETAKVMAAAISTFRKSKTK